MANPERVYKQLFDAYRPGFDPDSLRDKLTDPGILEPDDFVINDVAFRIAPQNIVISKESYNNSWETLRTSSPRKIKSGYGITRISLQQIFNVYQDVDLMNLMKLVAGLRATPFCVVYSKYLDRALGRPEQDFIGDKSSIQEANPFQPIMLGLTTMSFSTMGHQGHPSCISAIFEFIWFNYLPYTPYIAFRSGDNYDQPDYPWKSDPWKAFYRKFLSEHVPVSFPHKTNDYFSRTTEFSWREFVVVPTGTTQGLAGARDLTKALLRKPKEIANMLSSIISEGAPNNNLTNSNPEIITSGILDTLLKRAIRQGVINPSEEVAMQINSMAEGAVTNASQDLLAPVFRGLLNEADNTRALNYKDADLALKIIEDRIEKSKEFNSRSDKIVRQNPDSEGFQPVFDTNGKTQVGLSNGGLKVLGRRVSHKIGHSVDLPDVDNSAIIEQITVTFQNKLSVIPMIAYRYPTLQHTGNLDATVSIVIDADNSSVKSIREMYDRMELTSLKFRNIPSGYRNLEIYNDFLKLFALEEFITEKLSIKANDQCPARSNIYMELCEAGLKSSDRDPERMTQERISRHESVYEEIWKVISKNLMVVTNSSVTYNQGFGRGDMPFSNYSSPTVQQHTPVERDYYKVKPNAIGMETTHAAYVDLVKRSADILNEFIVKAHDELFSFGDGSVVQNAKYSALMNLNDKSSRFQFIPQLNQVKAGIRQRNQARKEKGKLHLSITHTYSRNTKEAEAAKTAQRYTGNIINVDPTKRVSSYDDLPAQQKKVLDNTARYLELLGVNKYVAKMTALLQEIQDRHLLLDQFKHVSKIIEDFGFDVGNSAYPDFTKQLTGVVELVGDQSSSNFEKVISNYNPDCYFYYPFYHGATSSNYLGVIDEQAINLAQKHSIELTRTAYNSINQFFQGTYHERLNNPENQNAYKRLVEDFQGTQIQSEVGAPAFFYNNIDIENNTKSQEISKTYTCDFISKSSANAYPEEGPLNISCPSTCTHTTNIDKMWEGVRVSSNDPYGLNANVTPTIGYPEIQGSRQEASQNGIQLSVPITIPVGNLPIGYLYGGGERNYGGKRRTHHGLDMPYYGNQYKGGSGDKILGSKVLAAATGEIFYVKHFGRIGGLSIGIRHKGNWTTEYMHLKEGSIPANIMSQINPNTGYPKSPIVVSAGQQIAQIGRTGNVSSPTHLHFQVKHKGQTVDPMLFLPDLQKHAKNLQANTTPKSIKERQDAERIQPIKTDLLTDVASPIALSIKEFERKLYSGKFQTMMRAYPTFKLYFIESDVGERKRLAFDDFFSYQSVQSIRVYKDVEIAADICVIYLTNISGILSNRKFNQLKDGDVPRDDSGNALLETSDPSAVDTKKENPIASMLLQEGVHIHLKLGYQNKASNLTSVFSGIISSVEFSDADDLVCVTAQSYGVQLVQDIKGIESPKVQSSSNLSIPSIFNLKFWGFKDKATTARIFEEMLAEPEVTHFGRWNPKGGSLNQVRNLLTQRWTFSPQPADDNIFAPSEKQDLNAFGNGLLFKDLAYVIYKTTLWDIFQEMTLRHPNYIAVPRLYQDKYGERMTFFFGLPNQLYFCRALTADEERADMKLLKAQQEINNNLKNKILPSKYDKESETKRQAIMSTTIQGAITNLAIEKTLNALADEEEYEKLLREKELLFESRLALAKKQGYIKPFRNYHLITSSNHLIANNIKANSRDVANTIIIQYPKSITMKDDDDDPDDGAIKVSGEQEFVLKLDNGLPPENTRAQIGQFMNVTNDKLAKRYALGLLSRNIKNTYKGEIIITGDPDIELYDYCYLTDDYSDMTGAFEVKSVEHIFDQENGFRTAIRPSMIVHASEISQLSSAEALGIIMESVLHKKNKYDSAGIPMSFSSTALGYGIWAMGGFLSQKLIYYTQLAQPLILSPMQYRGQPFTGGLSLDKISTATWSTAFGIWAPLTDIGFADWKEDLKGKILGSIKKAFFGFTVGEYSSTGGDYPV